MPLREFAQAIENLSVLAIGGRLFLSLLRGALRFVAVLFLLQIELIQLLLLLLRARLTLLLTLLALLLLLLLADDFMLASPQLEQTLIGGLLSR